MIRISRRPLLAGLAALPAVSARAAGPVGIWALDGEAWAAELERVIPLLVAQLPEEARKTMEARGFDLAGKLRQGLSRGLDGTLELQADGTLVARNGAGEDDGEGRWRLAGDDRIEITLPEDRLTLRGIVEADRMVLYPVPETAQTAADPLVRAAVEAMTFELVRRQG